MTSLPFLILLAAAGSAPRAGAVVIGPDVARVGGLQREIDSSLAAQHGIEAVRAPALAGGRLGGAADPNIADRAKTRRRIATLVSESEAALYDDHLDEALERLGAAIALQEQDPYLPAVDRANLILRRANAFLGLGNLARADAEARAALSLLPDLSVDGKVFPPSLVDRVAQLRSAPWPTVPVSIACHPETCRVRLDDRAVEAESMVAAGRHWLVASAPGFEDLALALDVAAPVTLQIDLSLAVSPSLESSLEERLAKGGGTDADLRIFASVAKRLDLDVLAIASIRGESERAVVWWRGMKPDDLRVISGSTAAGRVALVDEIAKRVRNAKPAPRRRQCWPF